MAKSPKYISDFIQNNFIDKFNKTTNLSFYRKQLSNNSKPILHENEPKITMKASSTSKIEDFGSSEPASFIINDDRAPNELIRRNVYEDFKESMAAIASKRQVSSEKLLSKTFSQNGMRSSETPVINYYKKGISSCMPENKTVFLEQKNNQNLKKMHRKFNLKINIESKESVVGQQNQKSLFSMRVKPNPSIENGDVCGYIKTEPCHNSKKESLGSEESIHHGFKNVQKPRKKSRVNKVYSMQPTINDHIKSKLDHKNASNVGTTEEEFESDEISEGEIELKETNKIAKVEISEGIIYGKGGIPVNFQSNAEAAPYSLENKENSNKKLNESIESKTKSNGHKMHINWKFEGLSSIILLFFVIKSNKRHKKLENSESRLGDAEEEAQRIRS